MADVQDDVGEEPTPDWTCNPEADRPAWDIKSGVQTLDLISQLTRNAAASYLRSGIDGDANRHPLPG